MSSPRRRAFKATDNNEEDIPLHHLRPFGTGLYKQQIKFVPASDGDLDSTSSTAAKSSKPKLDVADLYLNMVLANKAKSKDKQREEEPPPTATASDTTQTTTPTPTPTPAEPPIPPQVTCQICLLPYIPTPQGLSAHESSFAHQSRLPHSHPPSALDRTRMGLKTLSAQGWDPDSRQGLGSAAQGIQFPIKPKKKDDHLGLGIEVPKGGVPVLPKKKEKLLDAKKVRKMQEQDRKRGERIQRELWGRGPDLERYLGKGGGG